uniref:Uncharacterized protein n=1 Tax=Avena sativa TaxID=4498 RepID=A0ACD5TL18_AVESA
MANGGPPLNRWSSQHTVVAAAVGILVVIAIAIVVIISLSPPQLQFSIQDAGLNKGWYGGQQFYNFTLTANNTSPRMEVRYTTLNTEIWISPTMWYSADMNMSRFHFHQGYVQSPENVTNVPGWAEYYESDSTTESAQDAGTGHWPNCTVVVIAKVVFKVGLARTRPYHIRVSCFPVNFLHPSQTPYANCTY